MLEHKVMTPNKTITLHQFKKKQNFSLFIDKDILNCTFKTCFLFFFKLIEKQNLKGN